uniref:Vesicle-associated membrane protein 7 n=1 Tax=Strigamia maritima TaxID=126957 RepID=T1JBQ6_STRMM
MPILYSVVARGITVLAKYASCAGNFAEVTEQILAKIAPENGKLTYSHGSYLFHYVSDDRIIYLCITDDDFERSRAFCYLSEIKKRFQTSYGERAKTALPFAMNSEFSRILAAQMKHFSEAKDFDTVSKVQGELDELKDIMVKNIDNIATRGERLELLVSKTDNLCSESVQFRVRSRTLARSIYWKNIKLTVIIVVVVIVDW